MGNFASEKRGFFCSASNWFEKHWIIKTLITFLPTIWLPVIVKLFGVNLSISDEAGTLSFWGKIITIALYLLVLFVLILGGISAKNKKELQDEFKEKLDKAINGQFYYEYILSGIDSVNKDICTDLLKKIKQKEKANTPVDSLRIIAKSVQSCCSSQFDLSANKILVSMAYCLGSGNRPEDWKWANPEEVQGGLKLSELTSNSQTAFFRVMNRSEQFIYYNEKTAAIAENKYVPDERDKKHKNIGSIVVCDITATEVTSNVTIARAILSISTFTKCVSKATDENSIKDVERNLVGILDYYENLIRRELATLAACDSVDK